MMKKGYRIARVVAKVSAILAVIGAYFLVRQSLENKLVGCGAGSSCEAVLSGSWSYVFGVSVAWLALPIYLGLLWRVGKLGRNESAAGYLLGTAVAYSVLLAALWFVCLQVFIIGAFCKWCCATHGFAVISAVLYLSLRECRGSWRKSAMAAGVCLAMTACVSMILLSIISPAEARYGSMEMNDGGIQSNDETIVLYGGKIVLSKSELPMIAGSKGGKKGNAVGLLLSDYTCPHCLEYMAALMNDSQRLGEMGEWYFLPAYRTPEAREIQRLMLVVWKVDAYIYRDLVRRLPESGVDLTYEGFYQHVDALFDGKLKQYMQLHADWAATVLKQGGDLFAMNEREAGATLLPQLVLGSRVYEGKVPIQELEEIARGIVVKGVAMEVKGGVQNQQTDVTFSPAVFELGRVMRGQSAEGVFTIKNLSEKNQKITKSRVTCGCVKVELEPRTLAPGEELKVPFTFDSSKFTGKVEQGMVVYLEGVKKPLSMMAKADVWMPVRPMPARLGFGNVVKGSLGVSEKVSILSAVEEDIELLLESSDVGGFHGELVPVEGGKHYELVVSIAEMPEGDLRGEFVVKTNYPEFSSFKVPVSARAADAVEVTRTEIQLKELVPGNRIRWIVSCHDKEKQKGFDVTSIAAGGMDKINVDVQRREGRITIGWVVPDGFDAKKALQDGAEITMKTNYPGYEEIRLKCVE